jgi:GNAT superfamily N-acetyltransferase
MPIRVATPAETDQVRALVERAYGHYIARIGMRPGPMEADYDALVEAGAVFVLADPDIAGLIVLQDTPDHLLIENVAVDPDRQGEGLGRTLLDFGEQEARRRGLREMRLFTHELMTENIVMYARLGWDEYARRPEDGFSLVYFRKPLGGG